MDHWAPRRMSGRLRFKAEPLWCREPEQKRQLAFRASCNVSNSLALSNGGPYIQLDIVSSLLLWRKGITAESLAKALHTKCLLLRILINDLCYFPPQLTILGSIPALDYQQNNLTINSVSTHGSLRLISG
jgi:hypothetical protein